MAFLVIPGFFLFSFPMGILPVNISRKLICRLMKAASLGVPSAFGYRGICLQTLIKLTVRIEAAIHDPCVPQCFLGILLLGISGQVEELGKRELRRRTKPIPRFLIKRQLPIAPFDRFEAFGDECEYAFAVGLPLSAEQEIRLIYSINGPVGRHRRISDPG